MNWTDLPQDVIDEILSNLDIIDLLKLDQLPSPRFRVANHLSHYVRSKFASVYEDIWIHKFRDIPELSRVNLLRNARNVWQLLDTVEKDSDVAEKVEAQIHRFGDETQLFMLLITLHDAYRSLLQSDVTSLDNSQTTVNLQRLCAASLWLMAVHTNLSFKDIRRMAQENEFDMESYLFAQARTLLDPLDHKSVRRSKLTELCNLVAERLPHNMTKLGFADSEHLHELISKLMKVCVERLIADHSMNHWDGNILNVYAGGLSAPPSVIPMIAAKAVCKVFLRYEIFVQGNCVKVAYFATSNYVLLGNTQYFMKDDGSMLVSRQARKGILDLLIEDYRHQIALIGTSFHVADHRHDIPRYMRSRAHPPRSEQFEGPLFIDFAKLLDQDSKGFYRSVWHRVFQAPTFGEDDDIFPSPLIGTHELVLDDRDPLPDYLLVNSTKGTLKTLYFYDFKMRAKEPQHIHLLNEFLLSALVKKLLHSELFHLLMTTAFRGMELQKGRVRFLRRSLSFLGCFPDPALQHKVHDIT